MAYWVREPTEALGHGYRVGGEFVFIRSTPLVIHDECAHVPGIAGDPWSDSAGSWAAREAFTAIMGPGFDLCWSPVYSLSADTAPPCYCCGERVIGRG